MGIPRPPEGRLRRRRRPRGIPCPDATDVAWIRRVVPDEHDTNQSRWPTDSAWKVVQSATFTDAPAEARRLIRRKQQGADEIVLDGVQFGCMVSRVANRHADGGMWTLSRALRDALPDLERVEAKKTAAGKDFGELVRERRRQRGLPLPIADKVLPFRPVTSDGRVAELPMEDALEYGAEERMAEAWQRLAEAEHSQTPARTLNTAYLQEARAYAAVQVPSAPRVRFGSSS